MKKLLKNPIFNLGLVLVITGIVLYFSLNGNVDTILEAVRQMNYGYILLCLIIAIFWQMLIGYALTLYSNISNPEYTFGKGFLNALVASLFNNITPSATGGQIAQFFVFRKQGLKEESIAAVLWQEFIIYQSTLCLMSLFLIILKFKYFHDQFSNLFSFVIIGFIVNSAIIVLLFALARFKKLQDWISGSLIKFLVKIHVVKNEEETRNATVTKLEEFRIQSYSLFKNKKVLIKGFVSCIFRLTAYYSIPFVVFIALGNEPTIGLFIDCLAMGGFVAICSAMIPIPGAAGGTEAIFVAMFGNLFTPVEATTAMIIWRFFTFYMMIILGAFAYGYYKFKKD